MLRTHFDKTSSRRRAAILMVTIVLLTLFLVVGICFVLFADAQATSSRTYREASHYLADKYPSADELFGWALGEIIYDSPDSGGGQSAVYGHSLARTMYGANYRAIPQPGGTVQISYLDAAGNPINGTPFNGAGRPASLRNQINYQTMPTGARRPEWLDAAGASDTDTGGTMYYTGGFNAPYTFPDLNNLFLASMLADGTVLKPSYWPGDLNGLGAASPANPNLSNAAYQRFSLRPLNAPTLHPNFPTIGNGGDIRNRPLGWGPAGNDSVWIDLGYPIITLAASGRKVKPMFAILITDLDGRVNLNATGNLRGNPSNPPYPPAMGGVPATDIHTSHQGWGRTEINPLQLGGWTLAEYQQMFWGNPAIGTGLNGRYGLWANQNLQAKPTPTYFAPPNNRTTPGKSPLYYARADYDASTLPVASGPADGFNQMMLPAALSGTPSGYFSPFPFFGNRFGDGQVFEATNHPFLYNPFMLNRFGTLNNNVNNEKDRLFPISDMRWLMAFNSSTEIANSEVGRLFPTFMSTAAAGIRRANMTTTHSADLDLVGAAPGQPGGAYQVANVNDPPTTLIPVGAPTSYTTSLSNRAGVSANPGDLIQGLNGDWRSLMGSVGRVNVNRPLTAFPPAPTDGNFYQDNAMTGLYLTQARKAVAERVFLARDIFFRMKVATGVPALIAGDYPTAANTPGTSTFEAHRFLAQLAVNIVDYIDEDEFSTPFNWNYPTDDQLNGSPVNPFTWVFGTEVPRLVINEVYAQITNNVGDSLSTSKTFTPGADLDPDTLAADSERPFNTMTMAEKAAAVATMDYQVNFFVELHHPHQADPNQGENSGQERLYLNVANQAAYRIAVRSHGLDPMSGNIDPQSRVGYVLDRAWNVTGDPDAMTNTSRINFKFQNYTTDPTFSSSAANAFVVQPSNGAYGDRTTNNANNLGYYVVGPWQAGLTPAQQSFYRFPHDRAQAGSPIFGTFGATVANNGMIATLDRMTTPASAFDPQDPNYGTEAPKYRPTVLLQRLANPYLPADAIPGNGTYNPYITVDYVEDVTLHDGVLATPGGLRRDPMGTMPQNVRTPVEQRFSQGRRQPYRAKGLTVQSPLEDSGSGPAAMPYCPQHTFFRQNGQNVPGGPTAAGTTLDYPFDWLTHLDRQVSSPMELLHLSRLKPHLLTHLFIDDNNPAPAPATAKNQHGVPWRSPNTRLYRALELLGTKDRTEASPFGGKVMGKVNINTVNDIEIFRAICDAVAVSSPNYFTPAQVDALWTQLRVRRSPLIAPSVADRPIFSLGIPNDAGAGDPQYPLAGAGGHEKGMMCTNGGTTPFFEVPPAGPNSTHPYIQNELLQKIMGHLTTRSNVFAVWITTGFFEVENPFQSPPRIGSEVDTRMRHKFFGIIDRTNLTVDWTNPQVQGDRPIFFPFTPSNATETYLDPNNTTGVTIRVPNVLSTQGVAPAAIFTLYDSVASGDQDFLTAGFAPPYTYDLRLGMNVVIGSGDRREVCRVVGLNAMNHTITVLTNQRHHAGDVVCTQRIGNPGYQGPIDYTSPKFRDSVVPYSVILQ